MEGRGQAGGAGPRGAGRGRRGVGGAAAIQPVRAAAGGNAVRVHSTLHPGSVPRTTGSDQGQLRSRAEAGGTGSGGRSPSTAGGKHPGSIHIQWVLEDSIHVVFRDLKANIDEFLVSYLKYRHVASSFLAFVLFSVLK